MSKTFNWKNHLWITPGKFYFINQYLPTSLDWFVKKSLYRSFVEHTPKILTTEHSCFFLQKHQSTHRSVTICRSSYHINIAQNGLTRNQIFNLSPWIETINKRTISFSSQSHTSFSFRNGFSSGQFFFIDIVIRRIFKCCFATACDFFQCQIRWNVIKFDETSLRLSRNTGHALVIDLIVRNESLND